MTILNSVQLVYTKPNTILNKSCLSLPHSWFIILDVYHEAFFKQRNPGLFLKIHNFRKLWIGEVSIPIDVIMIGTKTRIVSWVALAKLF